MAFPIGDKINTPALYRSAPEKFNRWAQKIWLVQNTEDGIDALEDLISFSVTLCFAEVLGQAKRNKFRFLALGKAQIYLAFPSFFP